MILRLKYLALTCAMACTLSLALERRAYAYVDAGSGLLLFQSLSAMVTGALFFFRKRLRSFISPSKADDSRPDGTPE